MTNLCKLSGLALALLAGAPSAVLAQVAIPAMGAPAAAAAPAGLVSPAAAAFPPPVAAPRNIWSFLCMTPAQAAACKAKFCGSMFGQLINNSLAPVSVFTGGVIGQPCPPISPAGLAMPPDSALGAAAQVQKDTAEAAARRAAIRYLSTVDCNWWPEARDALINSLRADKNECVRLEAALALHRGCCCNVPIIKALVNTLSLFPTDGNPPEDSPRVRGAATGALEHCLACFVDIKPVLPPPPPPPPPIPLKEGPPGELPPPKVQPLVPVPAIPPGAPPPVPPARVSVADARSGVQRTAYRPQVPQQNIEQVVLEARRVLAEAKKQPRKPSGPFPPGERSLLDVIENALHPPAPPKPVVPKNRLGACENCFPVASEGAVQGGNINAEPPILNPQMQLPPSRPMPQAPALPAAYAPSLRQSPSPAPHAQVDVGEARLNPPSFPQPTPPAQVPLIVKQSIPTVNEAPKIRTESAAVAVVPKQSTAKVESATTALHPPPAPLPIVVKQSKPTSVEPVAHAPNTAKSPSVDSLTVISKLPPSQPLSASIKPKTTPATIVTPPPPAVLPVASAHDRKQERAASETPALTTVSPIASAHKREPERAIPVVPAHNREQERAILLTPAPITVSPMASAHHREPERMIPPVPSPAAASTRASAHNREQERAALAAPVPAAPPTTADANASSNIPQLLACLQSSPSSDSRIWAVQSLAVCGKPTPSVVQALLSGAASDASDRVRLACLQSLLQLGIRDPVQLAKVNWPRIDGDLHVREAAWRLYLFGSESSGNPRVHEAAQELKNWLKSRSAIPVAGR